ncbi:MAG TPA: hypothetical protein PLF39_06840 [Synergistales bacterium]|nr:hypothetical protein [Synergistales bacterium]
MSVAYTLSDGTTTITIYPKWDFKKKRRMDRSDHRMYDASMFSYRWAAYDVFEMTLEGITPSQAATINGWWENKTELSFSHLIGENLIKNGFGERGNNYNFPAFTFASAPTYFGDGCFYYTSGPGNVITSGEYIPIDTDLKYHLQAALRTGKVDTRIYAGLACYNSNMADIRPYHAFRCASVDTVLYSVASQGSTVVDIIPPSSSWRSPTNTAIQFNISEDYSDLPNSNVSFINSIDTSPSSYWRLTLSPSYPVPATFPAGTPVGNTYSGGNYNYCLLSNNVTSAQWTLRITSMTGINNVNSPAFDDYRLFQRGTAYVRFLLLANYSQADTTYVDGILLKGACGEDISSRGVIIGGNRTPFPKFLHPRVDYYQGKLELEATA